MRKKNRKSVRHRARCYAMQALYQWQFSRLSAQELIQQFIEEREMQNVDHDYFLKLVEGTIIHIEEVDQQFLPYLDRDIKDLSPVELAILRISIFELIYCVDVPYRVVINESLEIAKEYGATDGHKYINGILDAAARQLRAVEINAE